MCHLTKLFIISYFTQSNHKPHFEICLFLDKGKSEKYSINLCVRSSMIWGGKWILDGWGFQDHLEYLVSQNANLLSCENIKI